MAQSKVEVFEETKVVERPRGDDAKLNPPGDDLIANSPAVNLRVQETGEYIFIDGNGWATFDQNRKTKFILVNYSQENYIVVADGDYKNRYLSYNDRYYVGAYTDWSSARYWAINPVNCSRYPGLYNYDGYLCCNGVSDAIDKLVVVVAY